MTYFQVTSKHPDSDTLCRDHVVEAATKAAAKDYVAHRWSPAYGYGPDTAPTLVRLTVISEHEARDLIDAGCIDWAG